MDRQKAVQVVKLLDKIENTEWLLSVLNSLKQNDGKLRLEVTINNLNINDLPSGLFDIKFIQDDIINVLKERLIILKKNLKNYES